MEVSSENRGDYSGNQKVKRVIVVITLTILTAGISALAWYALFKGDSVQKLSGKSEEGDGEKKPLDGKVVKSSLITNEEGTEQTTAPAPKKVKNSANSLFESCSSNQSVEEDEEPKEGGIVSAPESSSSSLITNKEGTEQTTAPAPKKVKNSANSLFKSCSSNQSVEEDEEPKGGGIVSAPESSSSSLITNKEGTEQNAALTVNKDAKPTSPSTRKVSVRAELIAQKGTSSSNAQKAQVLKDIKDSVVYGESVFPNPATSDNDKNTRDEVNETARTVDKSVELSKDEAENSDRHAEVPKTELSVSAELRVANLDANVFFNSANNPDELNKEKVEKAETGAASKDVPERLVDGSSGELRHQEISSPVDKVVTAGGTDVSEERNNLSTLSARDSSKRGSDDSSGGGSSNGSFVKIDNLNNLSSDSGENGSSTNKGIKKG